MNHLNGTQNSRAFSLSYGLAFEDLYRQAGTKKIDGEFLAHLNASAPELAQRLGDARRDASALTAKQSAELIVELAPHVEDFIGELFHIGSGAAALCRHGITIWRRFIR